MTRKEKALNFRKVTQTSTSSISDEDAVNMVNMFDQWDGNSHEYYAGDRVVFDESLYRTIQYHISQPTWAPDVAVSLFEKIESVSNSDTGDGA